MNEHLVITWADTVPAGDGLAEAAQDKGGELLAAGPVHDASELDARPAPAGLVIARFSAAQAARSWFGAVVGKLDGTTLLTTGATAPVWWPPEKESERPQWSRRGELPAGRLGLFVNVWAEITDPEQFFDYSVHYRWTLSTPGAWSWSRGPSRSSRYCAVAPRHTRWP